MIVAILVTFVVPSAYHLALIYVSIAIMFFLVSRLNPHDSCEVFIHGISAFPRSAP